MTLGVLCFLLFSTAAQAAHSRGYLAATQLNVRLAGTPMRGTGWALVEEGRRWNVHPAFIAAVAGFESSYGAHTCQRFNGWGLGSCPQRWRPPSFGSWRESIAYFARWFRSRWPVTVSMWGVGVTFCPPCGSRWGEAVAYRMRLLGFEPTTRWK